MSERTRAQQAAKLNVAPVSNGMLQRKCACGNHANGGECEGCNEQKQTLQRATRNPKPQTRNSDGVPPVVREVLPSPGQPLDSATRAFFEPRFGHDFSHVRVHTDVKAADTARAVNALAYTVGWNIVFGAGSYEPGNAVGMKLVAHELAHTIQQRHATNVPASEEIPLGPRDSLQEQEATSAAQNLGLSASRTAIAQCIQRKTWDDLPIYEERPEIAGQKAKTCPISATGTLS
jgi:hypothetical protein